MANSNVGKITQIIGAVLDIKFSEGAQRRTKLFYGYKRFP